MDTTPTSNWPAPQGPLPQPAMPREAAPVRLSRSMRSAGAGVPTVPKTKRPHPARQARRVVGGASVGGLVAIIGVLANPFATSQTATGSATTVVADTTATTVATLATTATTSATTAATTAKATTPRTTATTASHGS